MIWAFLLIFGTSLPLVAQSPQQVVAVFTVGDDVLKLAPGDVQEANPQFGDDGPGLSFRLSPAAGAKFADLTGRNIGELMSLQVCDEILVTATIQDRLSGSGFVALDSLGSAVFYARRMTGEVFCE